MHTSQNGNGTTSAANCSLCLWEENQKDIDIPSIRDASHYCSKSLKYLKKPRKLIFSILLNIKQLIKNKKKQKTKKKTNKQKQKQNKTKKPWIQVETWRLASLFNGMIWKNSYGHAIHLSYYIALMNWTLKKLSKNNIQWVTSRYEEFCSFLGSHLILVPHHDTFLLKIVSLKIYIPSTGMALHACIFLWYLSKVNLFLPRQNLPEKHLLWVWFVPRYYIFSSFEIFALLDTTSKRDKPGQAA